MEFEGKQIKILFEDKDLMVVEKPAGLVVTSEGRSNTVSLEKILNVDLERSGIVHRLDKNTSGMVIVAKNIESLNNLKKQFKERTVRKKYIALVWGGVSQEGSITMPIGRSKYVFDKFSVSEDGKKAVTNFRVLERYRFDGKNLSLLEIEIKTGRTHQIRVHMSFLKWPIVGDKVYGGMKLFGLDRQFLHAAYLRFKQPTSGETIELKSDLSKDLKSVLEKMRREVINYT